MGTPYTMKKKNDIFSGLGQLDKESTVSAPIAVENSKGATEGSEGGKGGEEKELPRVEELFDIAEDENEDEDEDIQTKAQAVSMAEQEEEFARELKRAECIVETFQDAKVNSSTPMTLITLH